MGTHQEDPFPSNIRVVYIVAQENQHQKHVTQTCEKLNQLKIRIKKGWNASWVYRDDDGEDDDDDDDNDDEDDEDDDH